MLLRVPRPTRPTSAGNPSESSIETPAIRSRGIHLPRGLPSEAQGNGVEYTYSLNLTGKSILVGKAVFADESGRVRLRVRITSASRIDGFSATVQDV